MIITINGAFIENAIGIKVLPLEENRSEVTLVFKDKPQKTKAFELLSEAENTDVYHYNLEDDGNNLQYSDTRDQWIMTLIYTKPHIRTIEEK